MAMLGMGFSALPCSADLFTFTNNTSISIPSSGSSGPASPYPASITVAGITNVTDVNLTLFGLSHTYPDDINVILQSPTGASLYVWADAGGGANVNNINITFDDEAAAPISNSGPLTAGSYQVSQYGDVEIFPAPAPATGFGGNFSIFDGAEPNGTWNLFVLDDANGDSGVISGGWSLTFNAMSAVPEPTSLSLCAVVLGSLAFTRRRARS